MSLCVVLFFRKDSMQALFRVAYVCILGDIRPSPKGGREKEGLEELLGQFGMRLGRDASQTHLFL